MIHRHASTVVFFAVAACATSTSCKPDFGERESFVDRVMVLAVATDPPEAAPGETVTTRLLVASPEGVVSPLTNWALCTSPKRLTDNGSVSAACARDGVAPIGDAVGGVTTAIPADACFLFGPEIQTAELRPRDPDVTGGFYQPIRAVVAPNGAGAPAVVAFGFARIACNLANAPADAAQRFKSDYQRNRAPRLLPIEATMSGSPVARDAVPRGARVVLRAAWQPQDAETYLTFDVTTQALVEKRESLRVSWFTTAGAFDVDRTGRGETERETFTENAWTAPDEARTVHLFAVLRDARGGTAFTSFTMTTR